MSWSASQIFAEPVPSVIECFQAIRGLENSLFLVPHLNEMQSEEQIVDGLLLGESENIPVHRTLRRGPQLPPNGFFVIRELLSAEELKELADLDPSDVQDEIVCWDVLRKTESELPSDDSLLDAGHVFDHAPDWWINVAPPREVLATLKAIAEQTKTVVAYYQCRMWGGAIDCEFGWVWNGARRSSRFFRAVMDLDEEGKEESGFHPVLLQVKEIDAVGSRLIVNGDVLTFLLLEFGLLLSDGYFELERCTFPWSKYRLNSLELDQPRTG